MSVVTALKNLNTNSEQLEDLILLFEQGQLMRNGFERASLDTPDWLVGALDTLDGEIKQRSRDALLLAEKQLQQGLNALKTTAERRAELEAAMEKIQRRLGKAQPVGQ